MDARGYEHFKGRGPAWQRPAALRLLAGLGLAGFVFYRSNIEEVPYTHRQRFLFMPQSQEARLGKQMWDQTIREAVQSGALLPPNHPLTQLVARVLGRIVQVASDGEGGGYTKHLHGFKWELAVIKDDQVNAYVAPGGKVVVYTGLLDLVASEAELAAVLAHEAAHVVARHVAENMSRMRVMGLFWLVGSMFLGIPLSPELLLLVFALPHSRAAEKEADEIGIRLLARSCYDPAANVQMLQRLADHEKRAGGAAAAVPAFVRTHPLTEARVESVRKLLPEAYKTYHEKCSALRSAWPFG